MIWFDRTLLVLGIALCIFGAIIAMDLVSAAGADPCRPRAEPGCYPWGTEGPAAEIWRYKSKGLYLSSGVAMAAFPTLATALLAWSMKHDDGGSLAIRALSAALLAATIFFYNL